MLSSSAHLVEPAAGTPYRMSIMRSVFVLIERRGEVWSPTGHLVAVVVLYEFGLLVHNTTPHLPRRV